ncbi:unnamed protein product [Tenebrio molitor]|nr:unnamed protein product [Tenebrio molitor]
MALLSKLIYTRFSDFCSKTNLELRAFDIFLCIQKFRDVLVRNCLRW